jgi:hypothetical protein
LNYLASVGANAFSFIPNAVQGDDDNVFPYVSKTDFQRIDVSKTGQWEIVFEHADKLGLFLHFKTQEQENDEVLDQGQLGNNRKLYYRELIARFGHHLALNWNLGEENTNTDAQRKSFATYFHKNDPYKHPIVVHTYTNEKELVYTPLLGFPFFDGASLQSLPTKIFSDTLLWVKESEANNHKWVIANDEQNPSRSGVLPDEYDLQHDDVRKNILWGNIMAGGAGVE